MRTSVSETHPTTMAMAMIWSGAVYVESLHCLSDKHRAQMAESGWQRVDGRERMSWLPIKTLPWLAQRLHGYTVNIICPKWKRFWKRFGLLATREIFIHSSWIWSRVIDWNCAVNKRQLMENRGELGSWRNKHKQHHLIIHGDQWIKHDDQTTEGNWFQPCNYSNSVPTN